MSNDTHWSRRSFLRAGLATSAAAAGGFAPSATALPGNQEKNWTDPARLHELTATQAVNLMRTGALRAESYASALIERAGKLSHINALTAQSSAALLDAARAADWKRERLPLEQLGSLHGLPLLLKDNIATRALPTTAGTPGLRQHRPLADAPVAEALFGSGALLFGKANMHELAFGITSNNTAFGPVRNPYNPAMIPGGSSGGNAAAVAARMLPAGIGTDTGGSTRIPAALCGVCGMRPTVGRYPASGIIPISRTRDTPGPIARSVSDLALLDAAITGTAAGLIPAHIEGLRLGIPRAYFYDTLDRSLAIVIEAALARLRDAGAILIEADIPDLARLNDAIGFPIVLHEVLQDLPNYLDESQCGVPLTELARQMASPDVKGLFDALIAGASPGIPDAVYLTAIQSGRHQLQAAFRRHFREQRIEALLFPTTPLPARPIGQDSKVLLNGVEVPTFNTYIRNTDPGSNAGLPSISIPAGLTADGLPVGLCIEGPGHSDRRLLAIAQAIETVLPHLPAPGI